LIAERLIRFANLVGRENVMAGADCGFSSQALYRTEVHPTVVWEKQAAGLESDRFAFPGVELVYHRKAGSWLKWPAWAFSIFRI
jgi:hypothetical protein